MDVIRGQLLLLCDLGLISTILPQTAPRTNTRFNHILNKYWTWTEGDARVFVCVINILFFFHWQVLTVITVIPFVQTNCNKAWQRTITLHIFVLCQLKMSFYKYKLTTTLINTSTLKLKTRPIIVLHCCQSMLWWQLMDPRIVFLSVSPFSSFVDSDCLDFLNNSENMSIHVP